MAKKQIVILLHGIRTEAGWTEMVQNVLQSTGDLEVVPIKYGFFDTFRFLFPFFTRRGPIRRFIQEYRDTKTRRPHSRISVVAHSFGTYVVAKAIEQEPDIVLDRLVFAGSVVSNSFRTASFRGRLGNDPILNECGINDIWPVVAKAVTWGYGSTGTFGFGSTGIEDRFHKFSHSEYFHAGFVNDFWLPFLLRGEVRPSKLVMLPASPYWVSLLASAPLRWIFPICIIASIALFALTREVVQTCVSTDLGQKRQCLSVEAVGGASVGSYVVSTNCTGTYYAAIATYNESNECTRVVISVAPGFSARVLNASPNKRPQVLDAIAAGGAFRQYLNIGANDSRRLQCYTQRHTQTGSLHNC